MKYFVVSDIHSYYEELKIALEKSKFDKNNKDHILIVLGDIFDHGPDPVGVYNLLKNLDSERLILIKGNHEDLFLELLELDFPSIADYENGTIDTFRKITNTNHQITNRFEWELLKNKVKKTEIYRFIKSKKWINFYEIENYIFVHGFIPVSEDEKYVANWRKKSTSQMWKCSRWNWGCKLYKKGLFEQEEKNGKFIVCGHVSNGIVRYCLLNDESRNNDIVFYKNFISLDSATYLENKIDVLVIAKDESETN